MRVIAGIYKGRKLQTPKDNQVRPTPEKVKEALFSMLQDRVPGSYVCDLFAGTGALGIEALSRGASHCTFGDNSRQSLALIRENVTHVGAEEDSLIVAGDYRKILQNMPRPADIIFIDPPYESDLIEKSVSVIAEGNHLAEGGVIVCEHRRDLALPDQLFGYEKVRDRRYGVVVISLYM